MTIAIKVDEENSTVNVSISGRFDFSLHDEFRRVLDYTSDKSLTRYTLDFGQVEEIDSSAIGMILLLRDMAGGDQSNVELTKIRPSIKDELEIAQIYKLVKVV